ncbi:hypothetical protein [Natronomonas sp.]|uniref:hypothetical protein n=1 Tax=Natronomonas sp. TaxID=2184060 RepID=UPI002FC37029
MATDVRKLGLGAVILLASSIAILATGTLGTSLPDVLAGLAALGLAVGALLVGLSQEDAAV